jgi:hypothetical protein
MFMAELTITLKGLERRQLLLVAGGAAISVALAVGAIVYIRQHTSLAGLPRDSYQNLAFPAYFPKHPPTDFKFDQNSISSNSQVLSYTYKYKDSKSVYISIQPLDPKLDISSFKPTREISPSIGHGYLVAFDDRTTVAILAGGSFVLVNSPDDIPDAVVEEFVNSLRPVN